MWEGFCMPKKTSSIEEHFSATQVADAYNLSVKTVNTMCRRGELPGAHKFGQQWRIPKSALDAVRQAA